MPSLLSIFKSLEWVDDNIWDLTGLPDTFVNLLLYCGDICRDKANTQVHFMAASELLSIADRPKSSYDIDGPAALKNAIKLATNDPVVASSLASLCDTYYFLRSLVIFELDEQSFTKLVELLKIDGADGQDEAPACTHADVVNSLDAYLGQLEAQYPGIKVFANCAMLEANIAQEFGAGYKLLYGLRYELPADGELYMATLRCIVDSIRQNADVMEMIVNARCLYQGLLSEHWVAACNAIWELQNGHDSADQDAFINDSDYDDDEQQLAADHTDAARTRTFGVAAN
ncbi:hypothetical protein GGF37_000270 [Kickxella alabastrina]|nr:hypothetical protein GGF37_000270 [Kickxella alabastrina]